MSLSPLKFNLIAAACENNMGIGKNNNLPWRLKSEMGYFTRMTTRTRDLSKRNVVVMGRRTWDSIPTKHKPLAGRINVVLSRQNVDALAAANSWKDTLYTFRGLDEAIDALQTSDLLRDKFENVWIIGGGYVYEETMKSKYFYRLYLTKIMKQFDCDTFFPKLNLNNLVTISDPDVPEKIQEENGIQFTYNVYENVKYRRPLSE